MASCWVRLPAFWIMGAIFAADAVTRATTSGYLANRTASIQNKAGRSHCSRKLFTMRKQDIHHCGACVQAQVPLFHGQIHSPRGCCYRFLQRR